MKNEAKGKKWLLAESEALEIKGLAASLGFEPRTP